MARVLVIEDDDSVREAIRAVLELSSYEVVEARDGEEGMSLASSQEVDLVITDIVMPAKDGLQTIIELKAQHPHLPVIAISAGMPDCRHSQAVLLPLAGQAGADLVMRKPWTTEELLGSVKRSLDARRR